MSKVKVMVALRDKTSTEELTSLACQLAAGMGGELIALHVIQIPLATSLEAKDEVIDQEEKEILAEATRIATGKVSGGFSTDLVRARNTGDAIIAEAREQGVDLLVLGHRRQHELSEFLFGSTMRHVAHHAPCKVIVQIPAPSPPKTQTEPVKGSAFLAQAWVDCPGGITL
ncbi:MAG: universal stress protein [Nitrososphaerales archaeon]